MTFDVSEAFVNFGSGSADAPIQSRPIWTEGMQPHAAANALQDLFDLQAPLTGGIFTPAT